MKKTDTAQAIEIIMNMLTSGAVVSGQPLKESVIARDYGISRSSVREALNVAVGMGIVEYTPFCGYCVRNFTLRDILEWHEIREAIEPIAARRLASIRPHTVLVELNNYIEQMEAASMASDQDKTAENDLKFHLTVINKCGNSTFPRINNLGYIPSLFFMKSAGKISKQYYTIPNSTNELLKENYNYEEYEKFGAELTINMHRKMFESIRDGDSQKAEDLFRLHAVRLVKNISNIITFVDSGNINSKEKKHAL